MPLSSLLTLLVAAASPVPPSTVPDHPHVRTILAYRAAKAAGDTAALERLLAPDSRVWFGEKTGPGTTRAPGGRGPWADWDEYFRSEPGIEAFEVDGDEVRTTATEINDWYRLVDRPPSRYYITYSFDADGRIEGVRIHGIPGREKSPDRLAEFEAWATRSRPGLLERLQPGGEIEPSLENARAWKAALLEWREEAGLPNPLETPGRQ